MDSNPLVDELVEDGRKLIEGLRHDGFPVSAAGWLQESDGGQWFLYLASPEVGAKGIMAAYRALNATYRRMGPLWVSPFEIKLVGTDDPVAKAVEDLNRRFPGPRCSWSQPTRWSGSPWCRGPRSRTAERRARIRRGP